MFYLVNRVLPSFLGFLDLVSSRFYVFVYLV